MVFLYVPIGILVDRNKKTAVYKRLFLLLLLFLYIIHIYTYTHTHIHMESLENGMEHWTIGTPTKKPQFPAVIRCSHIMG